ncbi:hypothetical protein Tco_0961152, partial [Tanacetum coccineum]
VSRCCIDVVTNADGMIFENDKVAEAFVSHYEMFLGQQDITNGFCDDDMFQNKLNDNVACEMVRNVSRQEVKSALFSMGNDKSPSPDGYTTAFFKEAWDTVANDFVAVVCEFFTNGKILKELNHTIITFIPKVSSPSRVNDYRPISCCNVLFKCISKIIANRIKESLKVLVSPNQSAFVLGRSIVDNILLTQELMHNYHLDRRLPRCAFKVDIQKAYDTIDWDFLKRVLIGFGFHSWETWATARRSFVSILVYPYHGNPYAYASKRDVSSVTIIKNVLFEFQQASGVPLVLSHLAFKDCKELIERVQSRVNDWKNKSLLAAGRVQLVRSVLSAMYIYWASMFIIPSRVLLDIEQIMRGFVWCQGNMRKGHAKVAWDVVCLPKDEGGLGIRRLAIFNRALMVSHIWKLISLKDSLWVQWIHSYKLKGRKF